MDKLRRIAVEVVDDVAVVRFNHHKILGYLTVHELGEELFALAETEERILLSFEAIEILTSQFLGKLLALDRRVSALGGTLKICGIRPNLLEIFEITRLTTILDIRTDEEMGLAAFGVYQVRTPATS